MSDDTPMTPPSRRNIAVPATPPATPKTSPYVVKGSDIWTSAGRQKDGSVVELTPAEAKHFVKINRLAPYIPGEEHEG